MGHSKETMTKASFVGRELTDLVKVINSDIGSLEFSDRDEYSVVRIWYECGSAVEVDVTGESLAEIAMQVINRVWVEE